MKIAEIRELTDIELVERVAAERIALNRMVLDHSVSPLDAPSEIQKARRTIARMLTEKRLREINKQ